MNPGAEQHDPPIRGWLWRWLGAPIYRMTFHNWYRLRRAILRSFGAEVHPTVKFRRTVRIDRPWNLAAGKLALIGDHSIFRARAAITIGDHCTVSQYAMLTTECRDPSDPHCAARIGPIRIEDECWVAADAIVLPGVRMARGSVLGARALLAEDLAPATVAAGAPARAVGQRTLTTAKNPGQSPISKRPLKNSFRIPPKNR